MSAEVLRRAASLMRERAEAARNSIPEVCPEWHSTEALMAHGKTQGDAEHIASWHPDVALAVADWLDDEAEWMEAGSSVQGPGLALARAYLGVSS